MVKRTSTTLATLALMSIVGCASVPYCDFVVDTIRQLRCVQIEVRSFKFDKTTNSLVFDRSGQLIVGVKGYVEASSAEAKTAMAKMTRTRNELVETISLLSREYFSVQAFDYKGKGKSLSFEKGKLTRE